MPERLKEEHIAKAPSTFLPKEGLVAKLTTYDAFIVALARAGVGILPLEMTRLNTVLFALRSRDLQHPPQHQVLKDFHIDDESTGKMKYTTVLKVISRLREDFVNDPEESPSHIVFSQDMREEIDSQRKWFTQNFNIEVNNLAFEAKKVFGLVEK